MSESSGRTVNAEDTGQISVAELLARNGQQVQSRGGRRRRGAAGGISVAELTGELPVVSEAPARNRRAAPDPDDALPAPVAESALAWPAAPETAAPEPIAPVVETPAPTPVATPLPGPTILEPTADPVVEHTQAIPALQRAVLAKADADRKAESDRKVAAERAVQAPVAPAPTPAAPVAPVVARTEIAAPAAKSIDEAEQTAIVRAVPSRPEPPATAPAPKVPNAKSQTAPESERVDAVREPALFTGPSLEADLLRQSRNSRNESLDEARAQVHTTGEFPRIVDTPGDGDEAGTEDGRSDTGSAPPAEPVTAGSAVRQWAVLGGQAVVAIVSGALLFKGFEKLWESMPWVSLVLAVLVIAGLVAVVRILRQTEDLLSLLIAVIVGVFVTIGPLVFVLSSS